MDQSAKPVQLPSSSQIRLAIDIYISHAYGPEVPQAVRDLLPPPDFDSARWLMSEPIARDPASAPLPNVRSFALRLGNTQYPHMKLRLSRPPRDPVFLFCVDAHDAILRAPAGSADYQAVELLKRHNAALSARILDAWNRAGLPTERNYLRSKIPHAGPAAVADNPCREP